MSLKRDVIADNYDAILTAPTFIEKATLSKEDNFIFNPENMTYNEIKDSNEILLKDKTGGSWIVGYMAAPQSGEESATINAKYDKEVDIHTSLTIDNYLARNGYKTGYAISPSTLRFSVTAEGETLGTSGGHRYDLYMDNSLDSAYVIPGDQPFREKKSYAATKADLLSGFISSGVANLVMSNISTLSGKNIISESQVANLMNINRKTVSASDGIYEITVNISSRNIDNVLVNNTNASSIHTSLENLFKANFSYEFLPASYTLYNSNATYYEVKVNQLDGALNEVTTNIGSQRKTLNDAPYCMFCIPFDPITVRGSDGSTSFTSDRDASFAIARAIAEQSGSKLYDLQLLPYCPRRDLVTDGGINLSLNPDIQTGYDYWFIYKSGDLQTIYSIILWCSESTGTFNINYEIPVPDDSIEFKVENETTFYRLNSPNYSGSFQFTPTMNNGVNYFNVDYCYKPYQPYIHINPDFGRLYGVDTNDCRGLVCSGDFCLPQTSDTYKQYVINNKNYQESFNRTITNLEINQNIQMRQMKISGAVAIASGVLSGAAGGAVAGSAGTPVGAAIGAGVGAAVGLGASIYGYNEDIKNQELLNKEAIQYQKDQFGYQMANIKAQPDSLGRVSAYNPNNKIFPFLEKYTCTEQEKEALRLKMKYNGMTVNRIGYISDFLQPDYSYIKGKIIRLENLSDDFHMCVEISSELNRGVFIK